MEEHRVGEARAAPRTAGRSVAWPHAPFGSLCWTLYYRCVRVQVHLCGGCSLVKHLRILVPELSDAPRLLPSTTSERGRWVAGAGVAAADALLREPDPVQGHLLVGVLVVVYLQPALRNFKRIEGSPNFRLLRVCSPYTNRF